MFFYRYEIHTQAFANVFMEVYHFPIPIFVKYNIEYNIKYETQHFTTKHGTQSMHFFGNVRCLAELKTQQFHLPFSRFQELVMRISSNFLHTSL